MPKVFDISWAPKGVNAIDVCVTLQDTEIQEDVWHVFSGLGCAVTLGCSRRLDHLVIRMEPQPSFSQPNDRENQPLDFEQGFLECVFTRSWA